jgi:hypothetical protein
MRSTPCQRPRPAPTFNARSGPHCDGPCRHQRDLRQTREVTRLRRPARCHRHRWGEWCKSHRDCRAVPSSDREQRRAQGLCMGHSPHTLAARTREGNPTKGRPAGNGNSSWIRILITSIIADLSPRAYLQAEDSSPVLMLTEPIISIPLARADMKLAWPGTLRSPSTRHRLPATARQSR